jgi:RNA polymerase sigma factor (sigma-70 family)
MAKQGTDDTRKTVLDFRPLARSMARRYRRTPGVELEDLEQEAYVAIAEALATYQPLEHGRLEGYVKYRVRRHLWNLARKARSSRAICFSQLGAEEQDEYLEKVSGEAAVGSELPYEELKANLAERLSPTQYEALVGWAEGLTDEEIAARRGTTAGTVKNARYRALRKCDANRANLSDFC